MKSDAHFDVSAGFHPVNHLHDPRQMNPHSWPGRAQQNHDRNLATSQILLVSKTLIRCHKQFKSSEFCGGQQGPVLEPRPSAISARFDGVSGQMAAQWSRRPLVKQNFHVPEAPTRSAAAWSSACCACSRVTPGNHSINSSSVAPSRKFSNKARTGTLVPRKTQDPLTTSGCRSTAGQLFQSVIFVF